MIKTIQSWGGYTILIYFQKKFTMIEKMYYLFILYLYIIEITNLLWLKTVSF